MQNELLFQARQNFDCKHPKSRECHKLADKHFAFNGSSEKHSHPRHVCSQTNHKQNHDRVSKKKSPSRSSEKTIQRNLLYLSLIEICYGSFINSIRRHHMQAFRKMFFVCSCCCADPQLRRCASRAVKWFFSSLLSSRLASNMFLC